MTMKQRITVEQLANLTDEQKERLREWWKPQRGDFALAWKVGRDGIPYDHKDIVIGASTSWDKGNGQYFTYDAPETFDNDGSCEYYRKERMYPFLSIGQMIELLESNLPTMHVTKHLPMGMQNEPYYEVFQQSAGSSAGVTLCDALWEAVKQIL